MNHEEQFEYRQDLEHYIIDNNINTILQKLLENIMVDKPSNPIDYMIQKLQQPQRQFNFVIGPPGLRTFSFLQRVRQEKTSHQYEVFNSGQFILSTINQFSSGSKKDIKEGRLINKKQINQKVLSQIKKLFNSKKSVIIQGFPRNLQQAIDLQKSKISPTKLIFMNVTQDHLREICTNKIKSHMEGMEISQKNEQELQTKVKLMMTQFNINLKALKEFYNSYDEIDLSKNHTQDHILDQLRRAFDIKTTSRTPRTCSHVLVIGAPHSGRTTLAKLFAKYYNLVYISTSTLITDQIRRDTLAGRKIKQSFLNRELVDEFTIQKLIEERIAHTDCLMQGYVIEGFPKTKQQYENIKNLNLRTTLTVVIDISEQQCRNRSRTQQNIEKRYEKWVDLKNYLKQSKDKMFWVDSNLNQENMFQQVKYEFQKKNWQ